MTKTLRVTVPELVDALTNLNLNAPWTLDLDHDGTEDIAIIRDATGETLATSRPFWLPEAGDPASPTLEAMRVMAATPKLLEACETALHELRIRCGYKGDEAAYVELAAAIAEATGRTA